MNDFSRVQQNMTMPRVTVNNRRMTNVALSRGQFIQGIRVNLKDDIIGPDLLAGEALEKKWSVRPLRYTPGLKCDTQMENWRPIRDSKHHPFQGGQDWRRRSALDDPLQDLNLQHLASADYLNASAAASAPGDVIGNCCQCDKKRAFQAAISADSWTSMDTIPPYVPQPKAHLDPSTFPKGSKILDMPKSVQGLPLPRCNLVRQQADPSVAWPRPAPALSRSVPMDRRIMTRSVLLLPSLQTN